MNEFEAEALRYARAFAPEAEEILDVAGVDDELAEIESGKTRFGTVASRGFDIVDASSVAAMLINLFMWIGQIRRGEILKGVSREAVIQDISRRVLSHAQLSADAKERLVMRAFDCLSPDND